MKAIQDLHQAWCEASGQDVSYRATERIFYAAHQMDISADDIKVAVKFLIRFNNKSDGPKFRINCFKLIGDTESFCALVAEARAVDRNRRPAPTPKQVVIAQREQVIDPEQAPTMTSTTQPSVKQIIKDAINKL